MESLNYHNPEIEQLKEKTNSMQKSDDTKTELLGLINSFMYDMAKECLEYQTFIVEKNLSEEFEAWKTTPQQNVSKC